MPPWTWLLTAALLIATSVLLARADRKAGR